MRPRKPFLRSNHERQGSNLFFSRRSKPLERIPYLSKTIKNKSASLFLENKSLDEMRQWKTLGAKAANYFNNMNISLSGNKTTPFSCDPLQLTLSLIEEMRLCYDKLKTIIVAGLAQANEKKLMLFVGEDYYSKKSLISALMLIHIAKRYDIQHLIAEIPALALECINEMETSKSPEKPNLGYILPLAKNKLMMKLTAADHSNDKVCNEIREDHMLSKTATVNEHAVFIMGAGHLQKLMESKFLNNKYHVVGINISECNPHLPTAWINEYTKHTHLTEKEILDRINFLSDPEKIHQCSLDDDNITGLMSLPPEEIISVVADYCKNRVWAEEVISGDSKYGMFR